MGLKTAKVTEHKRLTEDVIELSLETTEHLDFEAGQFITIKVDDKTPPCFRAYSIASAPSKDNNTIKLCLKIVEEGRASNWLNKLQVNDEFNFMGPSGKFTFKGEKENILFIATGTGITPFNSMIEDELTKGNQKNMHLLFGLRHIKNIFYKDLFDKLKNQYKNFNYDITLSRQEEDNWKGKTGRVTDLIKELNIDTENTEVYICGLKVMIEDVVNLLKEKGMSEDDIHFEKYD